MSATNIKYTRTKLKNGLEVVLAPIPNNPTATIIVIFKVGARYEADENSGISHFLEHMVFKGNKLHSTPQELAAAIDVLGGSFNAFTTKEFTGFHIKVAAEFLEIALKWLGHLVTTPLIPAKDVEMERNVILEEINMYNDTPMMQIGDIFEELIFSKSTLGRNVIGNKKSLNGIKRKELADYFSKNYFSGNAVLTVAGNLEKLEGKSKKIDLNSYFKFSGKGSKNLTVKPVKPELSRNKIKVVYKKTDQTHLILGTQAFSYFDKRRYILAIISAIMGGGMSSWAFSEIREKRGLAYYVRSSVELHKDAGSYSISAGINNDKLELAVKEILKLFKKIRGKAVSPKDLKKAKDHLVGGMLLERETSADVAFLLGSEIASRGSVTSFSQEIKIIRSVGRSELKRLAEDLFTSEKLRLACIGPWKTEDVKKLGKLLK